MANVVHGNSDNARSSLLKEYADAARRERSSVKNGKGSRWRTLPTNRYKDNYEDIFRSKKQNKRSKSQ
jgi:hypothetical protein